MKERLDVLLTSRGLVKSREQAKNAIMEGKVYVDGRLLDKPGMSVKTDAKIELRGELCPFVGRGGLKLEKALEEFHLPLAGKICMDIGASTGGFTDCMLQHGAKKVFAVDVGYGQLAWKLRTDPRVINIEKCNFRYFDTDSIGRSLDFISIDVSFISLKLIFPVAVRLLKEGGIILCLVKPQFEAGREDVGKNGIVRDHRVHRDVILRVGDCARENGLVPFALTFSPVTGAKGNIEYLLALCLNNRQEMRYNKDEAFSLESSVEEVVKSSEEELL